MSSTDQNTKPVIRPGQTWKRRDGELVVVRSIDRSLPHPYQVVVHGKDSRWSSVYTEAGLYMESTPGGPYDLVELVDDSPSQPVRPVIRPGQVWRRRDGELAVIVSVASDDQPALFSVCAKAKSGADCFHSYTKEGQYFSPEEPHFLDLVELVEDPSDQPLSPPSAAAPQKEPFYILVPTTQHPQYSSLEAAQQAQEQLVETMGPVWIAKCYDLNETVRYPKNVTLDHAKAALEAVKGQRLDSFAKENADVIGRFLQQQSDTKPVPSNEPQADLTLAQCCARWNLASHNTIIRRARALEVRLEFNGDDLLVWPGEKIKLGDRLDVHILNGGNYSNFPADPNRPWN